MLLKSNSKSYSYCINRFKLSQKYSSVHDYKKFHEWREKRDSCTTKAKQSEAKNITSPYSTESKQVESNGITQSRRQIDARSRSNPEPPSATLTHQLLLGALPTIWMSQDELNATFYSLPECRTVGVSLLNVRDRAFQHIC